MRIIYEELKSYLQQSVPELQHLQLYNHQSDNLAVEESYDFPALFLGFDNIQSERFLEGLQTIHFELNLYLEYESMVYEPLELFDLKDELKKALANFNLPSLGKLQFLEEEMDQNHSNLHQYQLRYSGQWLDTTACKSRGENEVVLNLNVLKNE